MVLCKKGRNICWWAHGAPWGGVGSLAERQAKRGEFGVDVPAIRDVVRRAR